MSLQPISESLTPSSHLYIMLMAATIDMVYR